jgi:diguanylate cyclase (GGDEF)-like protein/PAS domain S-box-containing protein
VNPSQANSSSASHSFPALPSLPVAEAAVAAAFFLIALAAIGIARAPGEAPLVWPANAMAAALLVRLPALRWGWAIALLAVAAVAAETIGAHDPPLQALAISCVHVTEVVLTAWVIRRRFRATLPRVTLIQGIQMWLLFGLAIPTLLAIPGGLVVSAVYAAPLWPSLQGWWSATFIGALVFAPAIYLFNARTFGKLVSPPFLVRNLALSTACLIVAYSAIQFVPYSFTLIAMSLTALALSAGALGSALVCSACALLVVSLWLLGMRPYGSLDLASASAVAGLPFLSLAAMILVPVAVGLATEDRRRAMRALRKSEERFRESLEHSPIGVIIVSLEGRWLMTNAIFQKMLGYSPDEVGLLSAESTIHADDHAEIAQRLRMLKLGEMGTYTAERRYRHKNGSWIWTRVAVSLARDEDGHPLHFIGYVESLEIRLRAERALADERERLKTTLRAIAEPVITTDVDGLITYANSAGEALLGNPLKQIVNRRLDEVVALTDPETAKTTAWMLALCVTRGAAVSRKQPCVLHRPDGSVRFVAETASPVLGADGQVRGFALVLHDATEDYNRGRELNRRATLDQLTGLANRFEFERRLQECIEHARCLDHPATLLMIDLDRFKEVNDRGGHAAGDAVLRAVAQCLLSEVRDSDLVARPGGDEFAVILLRCSPSRGLTIARKILDSLLALQVAWGGEKFEVGASIGATALSAKIEAAADWVVAADSACYEAKRSGRGQLRVTPP